MRIGLFSDTFPPEINGVATSVHTLYKQIQKMGHDVFVITTKPSSTYQEEDEHIIRLSGISLKSLYGYILTPPFELSSYQEIKKLNLDVIHAHTEFGVGIFSRICAKFLNIPLVSTYHTTYEDYTHYINLLNLDIVDDISKKLVAKISKLYSDSGVFVIAPSIKTKEMLEGYGIKTPISVIPTGIDLSAFDASKTPSNRIEQLKKEYHIASDDLLILYVGRIAQEKSIDVVIEGMENLVQTKQNVKLLVIGAGPEKEEKQLKQLVAQKQLEKYVIFGGKKPASEIPMYYHSADLFVSASLTETQGMTFIEALASGLMILARKDDVLKELLIPNKTGYFFDQPESFTKAVLTYAQLRDAEKKEHQSLCVKQVLPFQVDVFANNVLNVYERAVEEFHSYYTITDILSKSSSVQVVLKNQQDVQKFTLTSDMYVDLGLRVNERISPEKLEILIADSQQAVYYEKCLNRIAMKDYTVKEMYDYLLNKHAVPLKTINNIIKILCEKNYLNDLRYANEYYKLRKMELQGNYKIIASLKKKGVPYELIEQVLTKSDKNDEVENAIQYGNRIKQQLSKGSLQMKKLQLRKKMFQNGFSQEIIQEAMLQIDFKEDKYVEIENLKKDLEKCRKRYKKKYDGTKLRNSVFKYLASLGYQFDDIYVAIDEMENHND